MGGIAGIIHFRGDPPDREQGRVLSEAVAHRGPDDSGTWAQGPAIIVQRRMALTHAGRRQPIAANPYTLALDGRIYELGALREALRREGVEPRTGGDADVVLSAWGIWGPETIRKLRGEFALAVWDRNERVLHLARDPLGVKPLYTAARGDRFAFASDVRALLRLPWVSRELAHEELAEYLEFRYTHAPRTLLRDLSLVPAGHMARVDARGVGVQRWWSVQYAPPDAPQVDEDEASERLVTALSRAVERRMLADHPVGVLLSGGTSSSIIASLAAERSGQPLQTFNVSFADEGGDEAAYAGRIARLLGCEHHLVRVDRPAFVDAVESVVDAVGQPVTSPSAIPQFLVYRAAKRQVRILLSGDGSDELLGGRRVTTLPTEVRVARAADRLPGPAGWLVRRSLMSRTVGAPLAAGRAEHYGLARQIGGSKVFDVDARMALLRDPAHVRPRMREAMLEPFYNEVATDPINEVLHVYLRGWLPEDSLLRSDRVSTAKGLEVRYPLLDNDVVTLAASWPGRAKVKRRRGRWQAKWPLKQALVARGLPPAIVWRPKRALPSPLNRWLRGDGEGFLWERVESVCGDPLGLFRAERVREMARQHARGEAAWGPQLWTLIFFDLWYRRLVRG